MKHLLLTFIAIISCMTTSRVFALQLHALYGQFYFQDHKLLNSDSGMGIIQGVRIQHHLGNDKFAFLGFHYEQRNIDLKVEKEDAQYLIEGTGTFKSTLYQPFLGIQLPFFTWKPYIKAGYSLGTSTYHSTQFTTENSSQTYESSLQSIIDIKMSGYKGNLGIQYTNSYFTGFIEYFETNETLKINSILVANRNYIDGEIQPVDAGDNSIQSEFSDLKGQSFNQKLYGLQIGIGLNF